MNFRGGLAIIKGTLLEFTTSKGFFWTLALGWMTGPMIYMFVWSAAAGQSTIGGFDKNDFILYYLTLMLVNQFTYPTAHWSTAESIQNGSMSFTLLRPLPVIYGAVACDMSVKVVCMPFVVIVTIVLRVIMKLKVSLSITSALISVAILALAMILRFLLAYIIALLAFWTQNIAALLRVNDTFVFLFAGQVAPIALFPGILKHIALLLPYRYMLSFPIEVLMGKISPAELCNGVIIQASWIVGLIIVHHFVYKAGVGRYTAVGG